MFILRVVGVCKKDKEKFLIFIIDKISIDLLYFLLKIIMVL